MPAIRTPNGTMTVTAVPVMCIEIPDGHAINALLKRIQCRHRDVVEITKTHGAIARGVMPGRAHQAECSFPAERTPRCGNGAAPRGPSVTVNMRMGRRIGVEVAARFGHSTDMLRGMRAQ